MSIGRLHDTGEQRRPSFGLELPGVASRLVRDAGGGKTTGHRPWLTRIQQRHCLDEKALAESELSLSDVADIAIIRSFKTVSHIDHIIERLEIRRDRLLKELRTQKAFRVYPLMKN